MNKLISYTFLVFAFFSLNACKATSAHTTSNNTQGATAFYEIVAHDSALDQVSWVQEAKHCDQTAKPIQVYQQGNDAFILRQHKCTSFEAPFMYFLIGSDKMVLVDTGAVSDSTIFPLQATIQALINANQGDNDKSKELIVIHTHGHNDHYAGDVQFTNLDKVTVIETSPKGFNTYFDFSASNGQKTIDLGDRQLIIQPIPGHQEESIVIYDTKTQLMLTGDTFYPGKVYVKDWAAFKESIAKLVTFTQQHQVKWILGSHIEMNSLTKDIYSIGTIYQPNEVKLPLTVEDLIELNQALQTGKDPATIKTEKLIVEPLGAIPKMLSNLFRWFS